MYEVMYRTSEGKLNKRRFFTSYEARAFSVGVEYVINFHRVETCRLLNEEINSRGPAREFFVRAGLKMMAKAGV